jgi:ribosomal protein S20
VIGKLRTLARKLRAAIGSCTEDVKFVARDYVSALDKAAKKNVIHRNAANRRKRAFARFAFDA